MNTKITTKSRTTIGETVGAIALFVLTAVVYILPTTLFAATLSIEPRTGEYGPGDTFVLTVRLDPDGADCVNAVAAKISYPKDWMKASAVSKGESLLSLWPTEPLVDHEKGVVSFEGGIPAGYCGRVQGDPGKTNILAKIIFSIPGNMIGGKVATGSVAMSVQFQEGTQVLLNDGFGTPAPLATIGGDYTRALVSKGLSNEWLKIVHEDNIAPDPFDISLQQDAKTFQGKYFIVFATVDKQSGVHHYEVIEDDPNNFGFLVGKRDKAPAYTSVSPYLLLDQTLGSRVVVRAFDHAGNKEESVLAPKSGKLKMLAGPDAKGGYMWWYLGLGSFIVLFGFLAWFFIRARAQDTPENPQGGVQ